MSKADSKVELFHTEARPSARTRTLPAVLCSWVCTVSLTWTKRAGTVAVGYSMWYAG